MCGTWDELVRDRFCLGSITRMDLTCEVALWASASNGGEVWRGSMKVVQCEEGWTRRVGGRTVRTGLVENF